ncbi:MAG: glycerol-3-phosphate acyltransferase [Chloroflexota bacterium]
MIIEFALLLLGGYLLGSIPSAYLVAKWSRGIDIRQYGSGNVGASNVFSVVSKRWAIPVTIFDIGKGALIVWVAQLLGLGAAQQVTAGIMTIIGHNWPLFLRFQGGRGVYTSLGVITMLSPKLGLITLIIAYSLAPLRQLALGVSLALISLPFFSWFLSQPLDIKERLPITLGFVVLALIAFLKRLIVPRTPLSQSVPAVELVVNRLLFDRDIRDRKTWVSQTSRGTSATEQPRLPEEREKH